MKVESIGWVVINKKHSLSGKSMIEISSLRKRRSESIEAFCNGSTHNWSYWRRNFNYECVKAKSTLEVI